MLYLNIRDFSAGSCSDEKVKLLEAEAALPEKYANEILGNKAGLRVNLMNASKMFSQLSN